MRAATEGSLPPVMPQGNLVEVLGREVRQGSAGKLMVESSPSRQRRPPCKTNKEKSDEAADAAALTYLLTYCLQDPYFGAYRIIRMDGSRIHVRCSPLLGGELLCAPKQLRHYHSTDDLSWDEWRLSDSEVERIHLENAASPEEADELE